METTEQEGIDATSLGLVLGTTVAIAIVTVAVLFPRKSKMNSA